MGETKQNNIRKEVKPRRKSLHLVSDSHSLRQYS